MWRAGEVRNGSEDSIVSHPRRGTLVLLVGVTGIFLSSVAAGQPTGESKDPRPGRKPGDQRIRDLSKRLQRREAADFDPMKRIVSGMAEVEKRLSASFDPGAETQAKQAAIIAQLDAAIAAAVQRGAKSSEQLAVGDARRRAEPGSDAAKEKAGSQAGEAESGAPGGGARAAAEQKVERPFREAGRSWGHLPVRDRDEVLQGSTERSVERFQRWIDRYYESLARVEERPP